jgi:Rha family phage regulatory protein
MSNENSTSLQIEPIGGGDEEKVNDQTGVQPRIVLVDGELKATSLAIAEHFGMEHREVLRAIRTSLEDVSEEFGRCNFAPISYKDVLNREQPMYQLTRNGFSFIAMGFTGSKAARWKEAYIKAFTLMEQKLLDEKLAAAKSPALQFKRRKRRDGMDSEYFADYLVALDGRVNAAKIVALLVDSNGLNLLLHATLQEIAELLGGTMSTSAVAYNCRQLRSENLLYYKPGRKRSDFHLYPDAFRQRLTAKGLNELLIALTEDSSKALH